MSAWRLRVRLERGVVGVDGLVKPRPPSLRIGSCIVFGLLTFVDGAGVHAQVLPPALAVTNSTPRSRRQIKHKV